MILKKIKPGSVARIFGVSVKQQKQKEILEALGFAILNQVQ